MNTLDFLKSINYTYAQPKRLLSQDNAKTIKGEKKGYETHILYMSPEKQNSFGKNLCPNATEGCKASCLFTAGMGKWSNVKIARTRKSDFFIKDRYAFMEMLKKEIAKIVSKAKDVSNIAIRLNGTTDIRWENIRLANGNNIMQEFPMVQFYDYTKSANRFDDKLPDNYHMTFSRAETELNHIHCMTLLAKGYNVAVVFAVKDETLLPKIYEGYSVVNGDEDDLRFLDGNNKIVGLKAKGDAKKDTTSFVVKI
jgi:hypothetical protein